MSAKIEEKDAKLGGNSIRKNEQVENIPSQADSFAKDESGLKKICCKDAKAGCSFYPQLDKIRIGFKIGREILISWKRMNVIQS